MNASRSPVMAVLGLLLFSGILFAHSSRDALDWAGTYVGEMPCIGGCASCRVAVTLGQDGDFSVRCAMEPACCAAEPAKGRFVWDEAGQRVTLGLEAENVPFRFFVGEGFLETMDAEGNRDGRTILRKDESRDD